VQERETGEDAYGSPSEDEENRPKGTAGLVDVREDTGSVASLGESGKDTRSSVDAGETNGENRDADGDVNEVVESSDAGLVNHDDERRSSGSSIVTSEEALVVVGKVETDDEEGAGARRGTR
jgi:hypothetical protein